MLLSSDCYMKEQCWKANHGGCVPNTFCTKLCKIEYLYDVAGLSDDQRKRITLFIDSDQGDLAAFQYLTSIEKDVVSFVNSGSNLYLYSSHCGNGKTSWSIRLIQSYVGKIWPESCIEPRCLFVNVPKFFIDLKNTFSSNSATIEELTRSVKSADLVVWDDIGTKMGTDFEVEVLLSIISERIGKKLSNVYTSNMSPMQINSLLGERLYSRIINTSQVVELVGLDKRGVRV